MGPRESCDRFDRFAGLTAVPNRQTRGPRYVTMFVLSSNSPHYTLRVRRALPNFQVIDILN